MSGTLRTIKKEEKKKIEKDGFIIEEEKISESFEEVLNQIIDFINYFQAKMKIIKGETENNETDGELKEKTREFNDFFLKVTKGVRGEDVFKNVDTKDNAIRSIEIQLSLAQSLVTRVYNKKNQLHINSLLKKIEIDKKKIEEYGNRIEGYEEKIEEYGNRIEGYGNIIEEYGNKIEGYRNKIEGYEEKIRIHEQKVENINVSLISILGIFVGIFTLISVNISFFNSLVIKFNEIQAIVSIFLFVNGTLIIVLMGLMDLIAQNFTDRKKISYFKYWIPAILLFWATLFLFSSSLEREKLNAIIEEKIKTEVNIQM